MELLILKDPIRNRELLNKIPKQTILISHHGSVVLESLFMGFKCIASAATFWNDQFNKLGHEWAKLRKKTLIQIKNWAKIL